MNQFKYGRVSFLMRAHFLFAYTTVYVIMRVMLTHEQHVKITQHRRTAYLAAIRKRIADEQEALLADIHERARKRAAIEAIRIERERIQKERLRVKMLAACGDIALTLDEVLALHPCRRISAVKRMLRRYWNEDTPVTAQQAIEAGCSDADISWVKYRIESLMNRTNISDIGA